MFGASSELASVMEFGFNETITTDDTVIRRDALIMTGGRAESVTVLAILSYLHSYADALHIVYFYHEIRQQYIQLWIYFAASRVLVREVDVHVVTRTGYRPK